jgi:hypothetical protein
MIPVSRGTVRSSLDFGYVLVRERGLFIFAAAGTARRRSAVLADMKRRVSIAGSDEYHGDDR